MRIQLWEVLAYQANQPQWKLKDAVKFVEGMLELQRQRILYGEHNGKI
jgi:hypothetical protein